MAQGTVRLLFSLVGQDKLSSAIEKSQKKLDDLADSSESAGDKAGGAFGTLTGTIEGLPGKISDINATFELLGGFVEQVAAGIEELADAEQRLNAKRIFEQTQGGAEQAEEAMQKFGEAVRGSIDEESLIAFINQMRFAGQETETITGTLEASFKIAQATNRDLVEVAEQLKDSLVTGSMSAFEQIGITKDLNAELEKQARLMGETVDTMSTTEKSKMRLAIVNKELETRFVELGIDVGQLGTRFQNFKSDIEDAKDEMAEFAAQELGTTQREAEQQAFIESVKALGKQYKTQVDKNITKPFEDALRSLTGLDSETVFQEVFDITAGAELTETRMRILGERLQKLIDEQNAIRLQKKQLALEKEKEMDAEQRQRRSVDIQNTTAEIQKANEDLVAAITSADDAQIESLNFKIDRANLRLQFLRQEISEADFETQSALMDARKSRKEITAIMDAKKKDAEDQEKKDKERDARSKERFNRKLERDKREMDAFRDALNLRDEARIAELKKQKQFDEAEVIAKQIANRNAILSDREQAKLTMSEKVRNQLQLEKELKGVTDEFERLRKEDQNKQRTEAEEAARLTTENEKRRLEELSEVRQQFREAEIRQAEELAMRAQGLSSDLRRYDDDTATVIQGQAEITQAIAANTGNAAKQAAAGIAAGGRTVEALIKNDKAAAATRAAFETAAGFASLGAGDVVGSTMHFTAAGLFAALAGGAGGKKGGGRKASQTLSRGGGGGSLGFGGNNTGNQVTVNVAGFVSGTTKDLGVELGNTIAGVEGTGLSTGTV